MTINLKQRNLDLKEMWNNQQELNDLINPKWKEANNLWYRAVYIELVESIEHYNSWKWWKKHDPDEDQTVLELVDCIHFILSDMDKPPTAEKFFWYSKVDFTCEVEDIIKEILDLRTSVKHLADMFALAEYIGFDFNEVKKIYNGKMALNIFRHKNGYQTGKYIKTWGEAEDNIYLNNAMKITDDFDELYEFLTNEYERVLKIK